MLEVDGAECKGKRTGGIKFVHVKAHVGLAGNEMADVSNPLALSCVHALGRARASELERRAGRKLTRRSFALSLRSSSSQTLANEGALCPMPAAKNRPFGPTHASLPSSSSSSSSKPAAIVDKPAVKKATTTRKEEEKKHDSSHSDGDNEYDEEFWVSLFEFIFLSRKRKI